MAFPRVIPHSGGAGGGRRRRSGVDGSRMGQRVWVYGAQSYRPFGTAAQFTTVPEFQVPCPDALRMKSVRASAFRVTRRTSPCSPTDPFAARSSSCAVCWAGQVPLAAQSTRWAGTSLIGTVSRGSRPQGLMVECPGQTGPPDRESSLRHPTTISAYRYQSR